ncbi:uncharacterized protein LOC134831044 [Culicoides brevitarsis]|uniref:uncharacterized protein LOC134831044 n=1 Tax=Culicoides brevitarsis TaxID=469753 RepID=UPI00307C8E29
MSLLYFFLILHFLTQSFAWANQTQTILIELPDKLALNDLNFFQIYELENLTSHKIIIRNLPQRVFGLLEVHSHLYSVGLENPGQQKILNGTNIGFIVNGDGEFVLSNPNNFVKVEAAIALVTMNGTTAPLPGGSSTHGPALQISGLRENSDIVKISTPAAQSATENDQISYETRFRYLRVGDLSSHTYFEGIKDMLTADGARKNGRKNDLAFQEGNETVSLFAKIKGTAIVVQTIALDYGGRSVYIPAVTYSCNVHIWKGDCLNEDPLNLGFYVVLVGISIFLMTRIMLPDIVNDLCVGMGTGLALGVFLTLFINMEMNWKAFIVIFSSLVLTGSNYLINLHFPKVSHYLTSFWLCYISSLTLFFVANFSFNLVEYQYIFLVLFTLLAAIILAARHQTETQVSIILGGFLFMFSVAFFTNGHLNNIIEQPYYLAKDFEYIQAVKRLLIAPQDAIAFCLAIILVTCLLYAFNRYGNIWDKMLEKEKLLREQRVALGVATLHERLQVASEHTPLISRYTETEEDEVFETPNTNRELYSRLKSRKK